MTHSKAKPLDFHPKLVKGEKVLIRPGDYTLVPLEAEVLGSERNMMGIPIYEVKTKKEKRVVVFYQHELAFGDEVQRLLDLEKAKKDQKKS